jgi:hypothetical protein
VAAANADFPMTVQVTDGQWTSLGPTLWIAGATPAGTYTTTITAKAAGRPPVSETFTVVRGPGPEGRVEVGPGDDPDLYKKTVTAGESATVVLRATADLWFSGATSFETNLGSSSLPAGITGSLSPATVSLEPGEARDLTLSLHTQPGTPAGTYEVLVGNRLASGKLWSTFGVALTVRNGAPSPTTTTTAPVTSSPPTTQPAGPTPGQPAPSPAATDVTGTPPSAPAPLATDQVHLSPASFAFRSLGGGAPADQALTITNATARGRLPYVVLVDAPWLSVSPARGVLLPGQDQVRRVSVNPQGLSGGVHSATITVADSRDQTRRQVVPVTLSLALLDLPLMETKSDFTTRVIPGWYEPWVLEVKNVGNAPGVAGLTLAIPPELEAGPLAPPSGPGPDVIRDEANLKLFAVPLAPGERRRFETKVRLRPEWVNFPGQPRSPQGRSPGEVVDPPKALLFASLPPAEWTRLRASHGPKEVAAHALKATLEGTDSVVARFRSLPQPDQYDFLLELDRRFPELADAVAHYVLMDISQQAGPAADRPPRRIAFTRPIGSGGGLHPQSVGDGLYNAANYYWDLTVKTGENTLEGFADGRHADSLAGLASGTVEVATFGFWNDAVAPAFGHDMEYRVGKTTGQIAATAESFLLPGAIQAGPKAVMAIVKGGTRDEPIHYGIDLIADGGMMWRNGESVNLIHVGKHTTHGWHVGVYGAGKPFTTEAGQKIVGTWAHFYPRHAYIAGLKEIPYATLVREAAPIFLSYIFGRHRGPRIAVSFDPNSLTAEPPAGFLRAGQAVRFRIDFENLPAATAEARDVRLEFAVDPSFDLGTFRPLTSSRPDLAQAAADPGTGKITWSFPGINLPPNRKAPEGQGYVEFSLAPKPGLESGTTATSAAEILFDFNPPVPTEKLTHTIDAIPPKTRFKGPARVEGSSIVAAWEGSDPGERASGLSQARVFVAADGKGFDLGTLVKRGPFRLEAEPGTTYRLRIMGVDGAGNVEEVGAGNDITVSVPARSRLGRFLPLALPLGALVPVGLWRVGIGRRARSRVRKEAHTR